MPYRRRRHLISLTALLACAAAPGAAEAAVGSLSQPAGQSSCLGAPSECEPIGTGTGVEQAVSPDGRHVYGVTAAFNNIDSDNIGVSFRGSVHLSTRDPETGALTAGPCFGPGSGCRPTGNPGIDAPAGILDSTNSNGGNGRQGIAVSPDGRHVYAAAGTGVAVFARDAETGELAQAGCIVFRANGTPPGCAGGLLLGADRIAISPDGRHAYVTKVIGIDSSGGALQMLRRDPNTGALSVPTDVAKSFQCAFTLPANSVFAIVFSGCARVSGLVGGAPGGELSDGTLRVGEDGRRVYAGQGDTVVVFARRVFDGAIAAAACITAASPLPATLTGCRQDGNAGGKLAISKTGDRVYTLPRSGPARIGVYTHGISVGLFFAGTALLPDSVPQVQLGIAPREEIAISADNDSLYVAGQRGVCRVDHASGRPVTVTPPDCVTDDGTFELPGASTTIPCAVGRGLRPAIRPALTSTGDGRGLLVGGGGLTSFQRETGIVCPAKPVETLSFSVTFELECSGDVEEAVTQPSFGSIEVLSRSGPGPSVFRYRRGFLSGFGTEALVYGPAGGSSGPPNGRGVVSITVMPAVGTFRLTPRTLTARPGRLARWRLAWTHPRSWRRLDRVWLRLESRGRPVGTVTLNPKTHRLHLKSSAIQLAPGRSAVSRRHANGRQLTARLVLRVLRRYAGRTLIAKAAARDVSGTRQGFRFAGRIHVLGR